MNGLLQGRVAVITGASRARGIGLATAKLFAEHGAQVALLDLDAAEAQAAATALGPDHIGLACDVRDAAACQAAIDDTQTMLPLRRARIEGITACDICSVPRSTTSVMSA